TGVGIEQPMRPRDTNEPVAEIIAGASDRRDLRVLGEPVVDLAIARHDLALERRRVDQVRAGELVHAADETREIALDDEIASLVHEGTHGGGRAATDAAEHHADTLAGEIRILLGPGQRELALDDP